MANILCMIIDILIDFSAFKEKIVLKIKKAEQVINNLTLDDIKKKAISCIKQFFKEKIIKLTSNVFDWVIKKFILSTDCITNGMSKLIDKIIVYNHNYSIKSFYDPMSYNYKTRIKDRPINTCMENWQQKEFQRWCKVFKPLLGNYLYKLIPKSLQQYANILKSMIKFNLVRVESGSTVLISLLSIKTQTLMKFLAERCSKRKFQPQRFVTAAELHDNHKKVYDILAGGGMHKDEDNCRSIKEIDKLLKEIPSQFRDSAEGIECYLKFMDFSHVDATESGFFASNIKFEYNGENRAHNKPQRIGPVQDAELLQRLEACEKDTYQREERSPITGDKMIVTFRKQKGQWIEFETDPLMDEKRKNAITKWEQRQNDVMATLNYDDKQTYFKKCISLFEKFGNKAENSELLKLNLNKEFYKAFNFKKNLNFDAKIHEEEELRNQIWESYDRKRYDAKFVDQLCAKEYAKSTAKKNKERRENYGGSNRGSTRGKSKRSGKINRTSRDTDQVYSSDSSDISISSSSSSSSIQSIWEPNES